MRRIITALVLIGIISGLILVLLPSHNPGADNTGQVPEDEAAERGNNEVRRHELIRHAVNAAVDVVRANKQPGRRQGLALLNDVAIQFLGRVEDENGNPLPGSRVKYSVHYNNGMREGTTDGTLTTDSQGNFVIKGVRGKSLSVIPERDGYSFIATNGGAIYSHLWSASERHNPEEVAVLRMWKLKGAEELIRVSQKFRIPYDPNPIILDLLTGSRVASGGDVKVSVDRPDGDLSFDHPKAWSITLEPVEGGLIPLQGREYDAIFESPESGYADSWVFTMDPATMKWFPQANGDFILRSRNGRVHAKLGLIFYINEKAGEPMYLSVASLANPSGSRNLEEDPQKIRDIGP